MTREVFDFYSSRAATSRVSMHVKIETEQKAFGNAGELRQVLSNLLANSLDACGEGDAICVKVRASSNPRDPALRGVRIAVADSGCGISREISSVFSSPSSLRKRTQVPVWDYGSLAN